MFRLFISSKVDGVGGDGIVVLIGEIVKNGVIEGIKISGIYFFTIYVESGFFFADIYCDNNERTLHFSGYFVI